MEPEIQAPVPAATPACGEPDKTGLQEPFSDGPDDRSLLWVFIGPQGLRAGWSVMIGYLLYRLFKLALGTVAFELDPDLSKFAFSARIALISELIPFLAVLGAVAIVARIEGRNILDFNLSGPRCAVHFVTGLAAGFAALSVLVGALDWGGWLQFGRATLPGAEIIKFGALWAITFLLVGFVEEGSFRCYLLFTFARGINFWWALCAVGAACADLLLTSKGNGIWGVYCVALLGLLPCLLLHLNKARGAAFWQAAWVTSTIFGFIHTNNNGENWLGIFAAAAIGFVFCVSVRVTGSAWWAIGCHAAWDWAETYFYGAADSGLPARGHFLATSPAGNPLWSGGADGPEGSLLVLAVISLLLAALLVVYGRGKPPIVLPPVIEATPAQE